MPTLHLYANAPYVPASQTNLAKTFKRIRAEMKKAAMPTNVAPLKRQAK